MLEDALKNMFPYKEISLKSGDTLQITKRPDSLSVNLESPPPATTSPDSTK